MIHNFQLTYAAFLFPAIPLMMISFNNRYSSLSRLIRKIHDEFINKKISKRDKSAMRYLAQIDILNKRLMYVKLMQLFSGFSFFFNLITILVGIFNINRSVIFFIVALGFFSVAIIVFLIEIHLSSKALKTHLEDLRDLE
ncbi:MAG: DUF2721 domain-containing protein [Alphaproteobacteria bacterium]|tara:strand:+ start:145 stop:564 length:420 start_codon:yes stop_codon:yes gene_type:complete